jgi:site-specific DNA-adenine methylase
MQAPFPWFGGKSRVAAEVWRRFGGVRNYVEPFFGSGAVLLGRPQPFDGVETINDLDGYVANFWRAVQAAPDLVAEYADNPVNENDLHARHAWIVNNGSGLPAKLEGDPFYFDPLIAGWWVWGICCWIGSGFASGKGPWHVVEGKLVRDKKNDGLGVKRERPLCVDVGINRQLPHLGAGKGVNRSVCLRDWFAELSARLARVRVCCGDWSRVCGPSVTYIRGLTGVFLDPLYADTAKRASDLYSRDSPTVAHDVREWAIANGENPKMRIALCGYEGEHVMPDSWSVYAWKTHGGYASQGDGSNQNKYRERIWFSPACLVPTDQAALI